MNWDIEIRSSVKEDINKLSPFIRYRDRQEFAAVGYKPKEALYYSYKHGLYRQTGLMNGRVVACWGVTGAPMGLVGQPYLITGNLINKLSPLIFARLYKKEVETMLKIFPVLENYVDARYEGAIRLLKLAGFEIGEPVELGLNKSMFCKFSKRID